MKMLVVAAVAALLAVPCRASAADAGATGMPGMEMEPSRPAGGRSASAPSAKAYAEAMSKMMADMAVPSTGDPDRDFARMMLPHHEGAVAMAEVELRYGRDPALRDLATRVVAAQKKEIGELRSWLAKPAPR